GRRRQRARRSRPHAARLRARPLARAVRQAARERRGGRAVARARRCRGRTAMTQRVLAPIAVVAVAAALGACQPAHEKVAATHQATLDRDCTDCHNEAQREGDLVLTSAPLADPGAHADVFEKVVHKLTIGLMPPPGEPRPDAATTAALVGYLVDSLDAAAAARPDPGRFPLHRLNRAEYGNAIRDLLGLTVDVATLLPADS